MKFWMGMIVTVALLVVAPALLACESCILAGSADPVGIEKDYDRCYTQDSGQYTWCYGNCVKGTGTGCPVPGSGDPGKIKHQDWGFAARSGEAEPDTKNCAVDVSGKCTAERIQVDAFLR